MKLLFAITCLILSFRANPACLKKPIVIAVIDSGFGIGWEGEKTAHLCQFGHKNFVGDKSSLKFGTKDPVPTDQDGHGTHIAGTIDQYATGDYCLIILKYYKPYDYDGNIKRTVQAIDYARQIHADIINYSSGGVEPFKKESMAIKKFIDEGGTFVAAAGNEGSDIDLYHYYPAQDDDRIIVVGNGKSDYAHSETSNYGRRVNRWENGNNVLAYSHIMSGTSMSTAIVTGKIVTEKNKFCK
jgi:subtilisin family serine protease